MAEEEKPRKHMANKQMERHMNHETAKDKFESRMMHGEGGGGEHESFHVFKHSGGVHSVHHHAGGVDHADHADHHEAMEHGKMAMGQEHGEPDGDEAMQPAAMGGDEGWE